MKYKQIPSGFFKRNRERLAAQLPDNSLVVLFSADEFPRNGDQFFRFRQNSDFFYLTGIDQEESVFFLKKERADSNPHCALFIKKTDKNQVIWYGKKYTLNDAAKISGIDEVFWLDELEKETENFMKNTDSVFTWQNEYAKFETEVPYANLRKARELMEKYPGADYQRLFPLMQKLRVVKSEEELAMIKEAVRITKKAYLRVLDTIRPGMTEYEVEAEITYEFLRNAATGHAYHPIVAGGENACILHYIDNDKMLKECQLVLMDFGAEYGNYAADCSRTIPVSGKFTPRQKECYEAVLDVFHRAKKLYVPGNTIDNINKQVGEWMQEKMIELGLLSYGEIENHKGENPPYFKYFMHGTSHFLGLDVHDMGTKQTPFEKGMVLTCEPGLYIPEEEIGIRIETDMVVADEPIDLMADFPVEPDEIEELMQGEYGEDAEDFI